MFCMNCGKKIDDNGKFCPFCGNAIGGTGQSNGQAQMLNVKKSLISKNAIIGMAAGVIAVLLVIIVVISGGKKETTSASLVEVKEDTSTTSDSVKEASDEQSVVYAEEEKNNNEMTLPEKLFEMPIEDYASMTRASFKEMLDEEGVLYTQDGEDDDYYYTIQTTVPDTFMGCDCTYSYSYDDAFNMFTSAGIKKDSSILATYRDALQIYMAFDTTEDFKDFKEDLEKNLNKKLVKGETVVKTQLDDAPVYSYLVECSDKDVGFVFNEPAQLKLYLDNWYVEYDNNNDLYLDLREYLESEEFDEESIQSIQSLQKIYAEHDYKVYKFIQVAYLQDMDIEDIHYLIPSDKSYTDITCMINVACVTLTEEGCDELMRFWENGRL